MIQNLSDVSNSQTATINPVSAQAEKKKIDKHQNYQCICSESSGYYSLLCDIISVVFLKCFFFSSVPNQQTFNKQSLLPSAETLQGEGL